MLKEYAADPGDREAQVALRPATRGCPGRKSSCRRSRSETLNACRTAGTLELGLATDNNRWIQNTIARDATRDLISKPARGICHG